MLNECNIIGHLGRDPETRTLGSGGQVCNFSVATTEKWRDKQSGERKERTEWHRVVVFHEPLVNIASQYLRKGSKVFVSGMLRTRDWEDKDGIKRYTTEIHLGPFNSRIILLDGAPREGDDARGDHPRSPARQAAAGARAGGKRDELDDEIPF